MKKFINSIIVMLLCITSIQAKGRDPHHLILEGEFLHKKNINYTVYKMNSEGTFISEYRTKARKYYSITCDVGSKYLIRFQDKDQNVKFLMLNVTKSGTFTIDVDFCRSYDAVLTFTKNGYAITPLPDKLLASK